MHELYSQKEIMAKLEILRNKIKLIKGYVTVGLSSSSNEDSEPSDINKIDLTFLFIKKQTYDNFRSSCNLYAYQTLK